MEMPTATEMRTGSHSLLREDSFRCELEEHHRRHALGACPLVVSRLEGQSREQKVRRMVQRRMEYRTVEVAAVLQLCMERLCKAELVGNRNRSREGVEGIQVSSSRTRSQSLLLTSSNDEVVVHGSPGMELTSEQTKANCHWETLEHYLEKYKNFHSRLPVIVAETLLRTDPHIELPLWLVKMFKENQRERPWGMTGPEPSSASLFRLYVDYGRYTEATNLFLEYVEAFASTRPVDIINRKRSSAVWFPYNTVERLWCQLEGLIKSGHMVDQSDKLKSLLYRSLLNHLKQLKVDSVDAVSSAG